MVNLEWYRTFKAVYEIGSLTGASKQLFISQPNVSQHISALEQHVGNLLFERKHKVIPTEYAKIIYAQIVEPITKLEDVELTFKKMCLSKNRPTFNIGAPREYFHLLAPANLQDFKGILISSFDESEVLLNRLMNGELDFILTTQKDENPKIKFEEILTEELVIVGSSTIDKSEFDQMITSLDFIGAEKWLLSQQWITYDAKLDDLRKFWTYNFKKWPGIVPHAIIPDYQTISYSLSKGNAVSLLSSLIIKDLSDQGEISEVWKGNLNTSNKLYLAYDPQKMPTTMIDMVKQLMSQN